MVQRKGAKKGVRTNQTISNNAEKFGRTERVKRDKDEATDNTIEAEKEWKMIRTAAGDAVLRASDPTSWEQINKSERKRVPNKLEREVPQEREIMLKKPEEIDEDQISRFLERKI